MKKKHRKHHKRAHARMRPRNAASGFAPAAPRPRARTQPGIEPTAPNWKTIVAAVAGGAGSAALGGLLVNQQILSPEAVGLGLMLGGGATAYFSGGMARVVGTSIAAAGAGQFALSTMNKRAIKAHADANARPAAVAAAPVQNRLPAPAAPPPAVASVPRQSSKGVVLDMFRDASGDLDVIEDEWRYGIRDDAYPPAVIDAQGQEPIVIDLDQAA